MIGWVWGHLQNVLVLIKEGNGENDKVETKRGKKFHNLDLSQTIAAADTPDNTIITTPPNNIALYKCQGR